MQLQHVLLEFFSTSPWLNLRILYWVVTNSAPEPYLANGVNPILHLYQQYATLSSDTAFSFVQFGQLSNYTILNCLFLR